MNTSQRLRPIRNGWSILTTREAAFAKIIKTGFGLGHNYRRRRLPYLVSNRIARTKKPFTIREELILPACTDICREVLGESAAKKIAQVPLSARTVARRIEDMAKDIKTQLLD